MMSTAQVNNFNESYSIAVQNEQVAGAQPSLAQLKAAQARVQQVILADQCQCTDQSLALLCVTFVGLHLFAPIKPFDVLHETASTRGSSSSDVPISKGRGRHHARQCQGPKNRQAQKRAFSRH